MAWRTAQVAVRVTDVYPPPWFRACTSCSAKVFQYSATKSRCQSCGKEVPVPAPGAPSGCKDTAAAMHHKYRLCLAVANKLDPSDMAVRITSFGDDLIKLFGRSATSLAASFYGIDVDAGQRDQLLKHVLESCFVGATLVASFSVLEPKGVRRSKEHVYTLRELSARQGHPKFGLDVSRLRAATTSSFVTLERVLNAHVASLGRALTDGAGDEGASGSNGGGLSTSVPAIASQGADSNASFMATCAVGGQGGQPGRSQRGPVVERDHRGGCAPGGTQHSEVPFGNASSIWSPTVSAVCAPSSAFASVARSTARASRCGSSRRRSRLSVLASTPVAPGPAAQTKRKAPGSALSDPPVARARLATATSDSPAVCDRQGHGYSRPLLAVADGALPGHTGSGGGRGGAPVDTQDTELSFDVSSTGSPDSLGAARSPVAASPGGPSGNTVPATSESPGRGTGAGVRTSWAEESVLQRQRTTAALDNSASSAGDATQLYRPATPEVAARPADAVVQMAATDEGGASDCCTAADSSPTQAASAVAEPGVWRRGSAPQAGAAELSVEHGHGHGETTTPGVPIAAPQARWWQAPSTPHGEGLPPQQLHTITTRHLDGVTPLRPGDHVPENKCGARAGVPPLQECETQAHGAGTPLQVARPCGADGGAGIGALPGAPPGASPRLRPLQLSPARSLSCGSSQCSAVTPLRTGDGQQRADGGSRLSQESEGEDPSSAVTELQPGDTDRMGLAVLALKSPLTQCSDSEVCSGRPCGASKPLHSREAGAHSRTHTASAGFATARGVGRGAGVTQLSAIGVAEAPHSGELASAVPCDEADDTPGTPVPNRSTHTRVVTPATENVGSRARRSPSTPDIQHTGSTCARNTARTSWPTVPEAAALSPGGESAGSVSPGTGTASGLDESGDSGTCPTTTYTPLPKNTLRKWGTLTPDASSSEDSTTTTTATATAAATAAPTPTPRQAKRCRSTPTAAACSSTRRAQPVGTAAETPSAAAAPGDGATVSRVCGPPTVPRHLLIKKASEGTPLLFSDPPGRALARLGRQPGRGAQIFAPQVAHTNTGATHPRLGLALGSVAPAPERARAAPGTGARQKGRRLSVGTATKTARAAGLCLRVQGGAGGGGTPALFSPSPAPPRSGGKSPL